MTTLSITIEEMEFNGGRASNEARHRAKSAIQQATTSIVSPGVDAEIGGSEKKTSVKSSRGSCRSVGSKWSNLWEQVSKTGGKQTDFGRPASVPRQLAG